MKKCTNIECGEQWPDEFTFCPKCGGNLTEIKEPLDATVSMGHGNAINGGLHVNNDRSYNEDNSVSASHNTTNSNNSTVHNTTTQNFYGGHYPYTEQKKSAEDILKEKKNEYRQHCEKAAQDGRITIEERKELEHQRIMLGLPKEVAETILQEALSLRNYNVTSMGTVQSIKFGNFKASVEGNMLNNIRRALPEIKVYAEKYQDEELQYYYYMVLAACESEECIEAYRYRQVDNYWQSFWTYVAFRKMGDVINAERVMIDLEEKWHGIRNDEDKILLAILGTLMEGEKGFAKEMFERKTTGEQASLLTPVRESISAIIHYDENNSDVLEVLARRRFYVEQFLNKIYKDEIEVFRIKKEQEEAKKKAEKEAREEEARKRKQEEMERKAREEAQRQREEEEKRIEKQRQQLLAEQEALRQRKEAIKRQEEEAKKRIAEEQKRLKQQQEQIEKEAAERRKKEEEARQQEIARKKKEQEEIEQRKKREAERIQKLKEQQEAERRAQQKAEAEARETVERERRRKEEEQKAQQKAKEDARRKAEEEMRRELAEEKRQEYEKKHEEQRYCKKCGRMISATAQFCKFCGQKQTPISSTTMQWEMTDDYTTTYIKTDNDILTATKYFHGHKLTFLALTPSRQISNCNYIQMSFTFAEMVRVEINMYDIKDMESTYSKEMGEEDAKQILITFYRWGKLPDFGAWKTMAEINKQEK